MQLLKQERLERAFSLMPDNLVKKFRALPQGVSKCEPYYSRIRVPVNTIAVAGVNHTFTMNAQTLTCFDYAIGESMGNAGFPTGGTYDRAGYQDTNLQTKMETINNEFVLIDAISVIVEPRTDVELVRRSWADLYCSIGMNGQSNYIKLGNPSLLGGGGGIIANGQSLIRTPNNQDVRSVNEGFVSNGASSVNDLKFLDDPIVWGPKGEVDSQFFFQLDLKRAISWVAVARAADAANNVAAFTPPAAQTAATDVDGTFIDLRVVLHSVQIGGRSSNR